MIALTPEGVLEVSLDAAKVLVEFSKGRPFGASAGIEDGDLCATDGHTAVRFEGPSAGQQPPTHRERKGWTHEHVALAVKLAKAYRRSFVYLSFDECTSEEFPPLSRVERRTGVIGSVGGPVGFNPKYVARLAGVEKACGGLARLSSLSGPLDPIGFDVEAGPEGWSAHVTIMPRRV